MADFTGDFAPLAAAGAPPNLANVGYARAPLHVLAQDHVLLGVTAVAGSTVQMADLDWECIIDPDLSKISFGAAGAGATLGIGNADTPNGLLAAGSVAAAGTLGLAAITANKIGKPLWQLLGYATIAAARATGSRCRIIGTTGGATYAAATDLAWRIVGVNP